MGQLQILIFQAFTHQTPKQSSKSLVCYLYLVISLGVIDCTKQEFNAQKLLQTHLKVGQKLGVSIRYNGLRHPWIRIIFLK